MRAAMLQHAYITNSQISDLLPLIAISKGYGEARGCGVDCKADSSWAQRRLPRRKTRERDKLCQGKLQIKADRVEDPAMRAAMLQHSYITNSHISDLLPSIAISEGYGEARGCGVDCKAVRNDSRGNSRLRPIVWMNWTPAVRAAMLQHSYITNSQISDLLPSIAISEGYGEARGCGVDCKADSSWPQRRLPRHKARERDKRCQGKFQIKADRVEDLDSGYACRNVTALVYH
ncbi:hypothetical protein GN958_ATG20084 [Phytophthora infestans]|uniref:Uncharacterized protein n=1 Tax=Phytophthora infestans TaxID=4787 RepID=A0A8S9TXT1_PHYIN|nr:hypothetical protein GN958_ATG20084 [Phytophthora infestans]